MSMWFLDFLASNLAPESVANVEILHRLREDEDREQVQVYTGVAQL